MKIDDQLIGKTLFIGVIISVAIVLFGGIIFLYNHGTNALRDTVFVVNPKPIHLSTFSSDLIHFNPLAYILLGVMVLFLTQLLRIAMAALLFYNKGEMILFAISCSVFAVILSSIVFNI